jgi:NAD(P)-dependent dehydrogenase (short-subunit alcohol dehydrogenase family)
MPQVSKTPSKKFTEYMTMQIPLGGVEREEQIAAAVTALVSDDASYIRGSELFVDGGMRQI